MKKNLILLLVLLPFSLLHAQWTNLGHLGMPLQMTQDYKGIRIRNEPSPLPANGSVWSTIGTVDDWVSFDPRSTGGGGSSGCCTVEMMDLRNDSVGVMLSESNGLRSIYHTTDAGQSWIALANGAQTGLAPIADLQAFGDSTGYFMAHGSGAFSAVGMRFTPSGVTIVYESTSHEGGDGRIHFVDDSLGFVIAHDNANVYKVFRTTDGGTTWSQRLAVGLGPLRAIGFVSPTAGFVAGEGGVCYATTDRGQTWNSLAINGPVNVHAIDFLDAQTGFVAGGGGIILRTSDGGVTFGTDVIDSSKTIVYVKAISATIAYAMTSDSVLYKRDYVAGDREAAAAIHAVTVFPNPARGVAHIALRDAGRLRRWELCDLQGQVLRRGTMATVDMGDVATGIYFLRITTDRGLQQCKVVHVAE